MPNTKNLNEYITEVNNFIQSANSEFAGAFSTFLDKVQNVPGAKNLTPAQNFAKMANFYETQYRGLANAAITAAVKANSTNDPVMSKIMRNAADNLLSLADQRSTMADDAWIKGLGQLSQLETARVFGKVAKTLGPVGKLVDLTQISSAVAVGDWNRVGEKFVGIGLGMLGVTAGLVLAPALLSTSVIATAVAAGALGAGFDYFGSKPVFNLINNSVNNLFDQAQTWAPPPRRIDPLVLDLDGDGIETIAQSGWNGVLFDHNGDGQKTGTGWLSGDDGFLTLDKNNNGQIDNGNELFGDNSQLSNGGIAADGYAALADIDSNQDGVIDATDTDFANLRVWQDINQDGISQASELKTLTQLGIASLSTTGVASGQTQNGNTITHTGTYTKTDGSTGQTGNLDLASSVFNTEYTETTTLSAGDAARADMHGAGRVRNLRHAAALSATLATTLDSYSAATTRDLQQGQLDALLNEWAGTSDMAGLMQRAAENGFIINFNFGTLGQNTSAVSQISFAGVDTTNAGAVLTAYQQSQGADYQAWINKLTLLERFNGTEFIDFDSINTTTASSIIFTQSDGTTDTATTSAFSGYKVLNVDIVQNKLDLLQQSYNTLKQSVYDALLPQTRFKPYLDDIALNFVGGNFELDYTAMEARFQSFISLDNVNGIRELLEFNQSTASQLVQWDAGNFIGNSLRSVTVDPAISLLLTQHKIEFLNATTLIYQNKQAGYIVYGNNLDNEITGTTGNDILDGGTGNDVITGGGGADTLIGGAGNDNLIGGGGADTLTGGAGDDTLNGQGRDNILSGGLGNDTVFGGGYYSSDIYLFNLGDGQDVISDYDYNYQDTLRFGAGIAATDITASRNGLDMVLSHSNGLDQVTIKNWFNGSRYFVEHIEFADGTLKTAADYNIEALTQTGGTGDDILVGVGTQFSNQLSGGAGNDSLTGGDGNDVLDGGSGNDVITGGGGADTLIGGAGNDNLIGGGGADTLTGGAGDDTLNGQGRDNILSGGLGNDTVFGGGYYSSDIYLFNLGDGQDVISDYDYNYQDTLRFGAGIASDHLWFTRNINDLVIDNIGSNDQITVNNWFSSTRNQIEQISTANAVLSNTQVANLVNAMSAFTAPAGAGAVISQAVYDQIAPVLTASWTPTV